jgi:hypothetical protein
MPVFTIGRKERANQNRVVKLIREQFGYNCPGNREVLDNRSIEPDLLRDFLPKQGYIGTLITHDLTFWM